MSDIPRSYRYGTPPFDRDYQSSEYTDPVLKIQDDLNKLLGATFNVCFLNRYDTQKNQLGWHADDSPSMNKNHPIAVVSLEQKEKFGGNYRQPRGKRLRIKDKNWVMGHYL